MSQSDVRLGAAIWEWLSKGCHGRLFSGTAATTGLTSKGLQCSSVWHRHHFFLVLSLVAASPCLAGRLHYEAAGRPDRYQERM
jgi:hypothetical protein